MGIKDMFNEFPIIDCENYNLRQIYDTDREQIYLIYSDIEVLKYQASKEITYIEEADKEIEKFKNGFEKKIFIKWCIADKKNDEMIGLLALHHIDATNNKGQIGYILKREMWNNGIMSSILKKFTVYLFQKGDLDKIEASIHPENRNSIKLAKKLGFVNEELILHCVLNPISNIYEDRIIMGLKNNKRSTPNTPF